MPTRLSQVVLDANDPGALARFWAESLGWSIVIENEHEVEVAGGADDINLIFLPVTEVKTAKNRVHLDLASTSGDDQARKVEELIARGASHVDIGQGNTPWVVLADPEGNEFCVLPPGHYEEDTGALAAICITAADSSSLRDFWSAATGWPAVRRGLHRGAGTFIVFGGGVPAHKSAKNRVHLDVAPPPEGDQASEVSRLMGLGARRVDIGQGDVPWVVLADPEDNEFCVLTPR
jgi:predicted enzyme related to lactoylglutathione lyase